MTKFLLVTILHSPVLESLIMYSIWKLSKLPYNLAKSPMYKLIDVPRGGDFDMLISQIPLPSPGVGGWGVSLIGA